MNPFIASYMLQNRNSRYYRDEDEDDDSLIKCIFTGMIIFVGILLIASIF